jgi:hypothetical protein
LQPLKRACRPGWRGHDRRLIDWFDMLTVEQKRAVKLFGMDMHAA